MPKTAERPIGQAGADAPVRVNISAANQAALDGRGIILYVNGKTGLNAGVVLTDEGMLYAIPEGTRLVVTAMYFDLLTLSDTLHIEMGTTENADGSGDWTPRTNHFHVATAGVQSAKHPVLLTKEPFMTLDQTHGLAFTVKATTNDALASATIAVYGFWEYLTYTYIG